MMRLPKIARKDLPYDYEGDRYFSSFTSPPRRGERSKAGAKVASADAKNRATSTGPPTHGRGLGEDRDHTGLPCRGDEQSHPKVRRADKMVNSAPTAGGSGATLEQGTGARIARPSELLENDESGAVIAPMEPGASASRRRRQRQSRSR